MEEISIKQRDILLAPFPFSNFDGRKVRPVLVLSKNEFNDNSRDIIVCGITSKKSKSNYIVEINNINMEKGKLFSECTIKIENLLKISKNLLIKNIGRIDLKTHRIVHTKLKQLFS